MARDHAGIKPLYCSVNDDHKSIGFASDKKSLWNLKFSQVKRVSPGNVLAINLDTLRITVWEEDAIKPDKIPIKIKKSDECVRKYQATLYDAVRKRIGEQAEMPLFVVGDLRIGYAKARMLDAPCAG